jgi:hypothetical protein
LLPILWFLASISLRELQILYFCCSRLDFAFRLRLLDKKSCMEMRVRANLMDLRPFYEPSIAFVVSLAPNSESFKRCFQRL